MTNLKLMAIKPIAQGMILIFQIQFAKTCLVLH